MLKNNYLFDSIAAIATPKGRGGIGVVRISGKDVKTIAESFLGKLPHSREALFSPFYDSNGDVIDSGIAIYFPAPHSFTGEDVLELQCHGSIFVLDTILERAINLGARLAKPGEFSERAFLHNKIDLIQAEAIADLIAASSKQASIAATRSLRGNFSSLIKELNNALIKLRTEIEAEIDFPEEELDPKEQKHQIALFDDLLDLLFKIKDTAKQGVLLNEGMTIALSGKPNAGKSSILNCLTGEETAIVTHIPGTTRDVLREEIVIESLPLHIIDTAGLQDTSDIIEQEGIRRARNEIQNADLILCIVDANTTTTQKPKEILEELNLNPDIKKNVSIVFNKIDLIGESASIKNIDNISCIYLSAKTKEGTDILRTHIKNIVGLHNVAEADFCFSARQRHIDALNRSQENIEKAKIIFSDSYRIDFVAENLRLAQNAISEITGEFTSEDLLDSIFRDFCIGK